MNTRLKLPLLALLLSVTTLPAAEDVAARQSLTLSGARKAAEAAVAHARAQSAPGSAIAIVDEGGHLLHFIRLDGTFTASAGVSIGKARTAALFGKPTADFENLIHQGRFAMTALPADFTPLQGGVPIRRGGRIVGAIGVSGAKSAAQDEEIALAGARVIEASGVAGARPSE